MAKMFCQRALDIEPTNLTVLDMLGNICAELGDMDKAKQISFSLRLKFPKHNLSIRIEILTDAKSVEKCVVQWYPEWSQCDFCQKYNFR